MKEIKYFCDDNSCKKELQWNETYFTISIEQHAPNMSYITQTIKDKHYCKNCFEKRYL